MCCSSHVRVSAQINLFVATTMRELIQPFVLHTPAIKGRSCLLENVMRRDCSFGCM